MAALTAVPPAHLLSFDAELNKIVGDKKFEDLEDGHFEQIFDKLDDFLDEERDKLGIPVGGADEASVDMMMMSIPNEISAELSKKKSAYIWWILQKLLGDNIKKTEEHWKLSTPVHLKIADLQSTLDHYKLGMGSVMLYHDHGFGDDKYLVSYVIGGVTTSRFSHATMVFPDPEYQNTPALWQSGSDEPIKLGGGTMRNGPDQANLTELIKYYLQGWPSSRFVFRPLKNPYSAEEQFKALQFKNETMKQDITFPSEIGMGWMWIISKYPKLAYIAKYLNIDMGVIDGDFKSMFCSMLVTDTHLNAGRLTKPILAGQFSPGDYGLPTNIVGQTLDQLLYAEEYEFIFDDIVPVNPAGPE